MASVLELRAIETRAGSQIFSVFLPDIFCIFLRGEKARNQHAAAVLELRAVETRAGTRE